MISNLTNKQLILKAIENSIAFAVWSFPNEQKVQHIFCNSNKLIKTYSTKDINKHNGFVFAPFQVKEDQAIYILPYSEQIQNIDIESNKQNITSDFNGFSLDKEKYIKQFKNFVKNFEQNNVKKAVLSERKKTTKCNFKQVPEIFEQLLKKYKRAFVYQVFIPNVGYWAGASPELLLETDQNKCKTVSLAGTQKYSENNKVVWNNKEKTEQEFVTKHIRNVLKNFGIKNFNETKPQTAVAGEIVHIKTQINFESNTIQNNLGNFIEKLHPTPAVCGLPVNESLQLILDNENYNREYYTGYLGIINSDKTKLYVNLRCLQAFNNAIVLYAGGGITAESVPEKEWGEIMLKFQTLENILDNLQI